MLSLLLSKFRTLVCVKLKNYFVKMEKSLKDFLPMPLPNAHFARKLRKRLIDEQLKL